MLKRLFVVARGAQVPIQRAFSQKAPVLEKEGLILSDSCVKRLQILKEADSKSNQYLRVLVSFFKIRNPENHLNMNLSYRWKEADVLDFSTNSSWKMVTPTKTT